MYYEEFKKIKNPTKKQCLEVLSEEHEIDCVKKSWEIMPKKFTDSESFVEQALITNSIVILCLENPTDHQIEDAIVEDAFLVQYFNWDSKTDLLKRIKEKTTEVNFFLK